MESPCTKVCVIDPSTGLCEGCWRSLAEVAGWAGMTDAERRHIMGELPQRQRRALSGARPAAER